MVRRKTLGLEVASVRLDRYSSHPSDAERFQGARFYFLPRKDSKIHLPHEYLTGPREIVERPIAHPEPFYRREPSETAFSADKRTLGWMIAQRRGDRMEMADCCLATWHNLPDLYGEDRTPSIGTTGQMCPKAREDEVPLRNPQGDLENAVAEAAP